MRSGLYIFFFFSIAIYGQSGHELDSLRNVYHQIQDPVKRADAYYDLVKIIQDKDITMLPRCADTLEKLSNLAQYQKGVARAIHFRGWYYSEMGNRDSADLLYRQELKIYLATKDSIGIAAAYNYIGSNFNEGRNADSSVTYLLKAIDINEKLKQYKNIASGYANLGNLLVDQKLHSRGIEYLKKALTIRLEHGDEKGAPFTYNNIAVAFGTNDQLDSALHYSQRGFEVAMKYENYYVAGVIQGGLAHLYNEKGRYREAIPFALLSLEMLQKVNRKANMVYPYINLAIAYNRLKQPQNALPYAMKGYKIMQELNLISPLEDYYEEIASSHELLGHDKESLIWYKKFIQLDDSLFRQNNTRNLADAEAKYQNQKKETELVSQRLELTSQANKIFRQKTWIVGLIIGLLGIGLFSSLYFQRFRLKKKAELDAAIIKEQKQGLDAVIAAQEEERKRISKDLHDGVAQELVALKLGFNLMEHQIKNGISIEPGKINTLSRQLEETTTEVRNIAHLMMPPTLEKQGLVPTLELLLSNTLQHAGVEYKINIDGMPEALNEKIELGIYRIAQEIINNIIKHSQARNVLLYLTIAGNTLTLKIQDDGTGYNEQTIKEKSSMGLLNIVSRVATLGGTYKFENIEPHGTNSIITVPVNSPSQL
jgi:signal transduction histidine kinase